MVKFEEKRSRNATNSEVKIMNESLNFDPKSYGAPFADLLGEERLNPLDPGSPNSKVKSPLDALTVQTAFTQPVADADMANACLSAIWLYHDYLEESHKISQSISTPTGSYWHGIMHRREPDFSNSKYWFRKVGEHPVFEPLSSAASKLASTSDFHGSAAFMADQSKWDPFDFVDLCEASSEEHSPSQNLCRQVQKQEWELLFDYCYHQAIGD